MKEQDKGVGVHQSYKEEAKKGFDVLFHVKIKGRSSLVDGIPLHMSIKIFKDKKEFDLQDIEKFVEENNVVSPDPKDLTFEPIIFESERTKEKYFMLKVNGLGPQYKALYDEYDDVGNVYKKFFTHITIDKALYDDIKENGLKPEDIEFSKLTLEAGAGNTAHEFKKSEPLQKDRPAISFPKVPKTSTRPDQEVQPVSSGPQRELYRRRTAQALSPGPEQGQREGIAESIYRDTVRSDAEGMNINTPRGPSSMMRVRDPISKPGEEAHPSWTPVWQRDVKEKGQRFEAGKHHEAAHHVFGQIENQYGLKARQALVQKLLEAHSPEAFNAAQKHTKALGYDVNHPHFYEEVLNNIRDVLVDPAKRKHFHQHIGHDAGKHVSALKQGHQKAYEIAQQVTPDFLRNLGKSEEMDKSGYGPKGMGLYSQADNARRKEGRTGEVAHVGPNKAVYQGATGSKEVERQTREAKAKSRKNPVKHFSQNQIKYLRNKAAAHGGNLGVPIKSKLAASEMYKAEGDEPKQYNVSFEGHKPAKEKSGGYAQYHFTKQNLKDILHNWDSVAKWDAKGKMKTTSGDFHPTAIKRNTAPVPIRDYLAHFPEREGQKNILYHGVGQDVHGAKALEREGKHKVSTYDPFHPDPKVRELPNRTFDEIHSHYTLNVVHPNIGKQIIQEIHDRLHPEGKAVISVRRDLGKAEELEKGPVRRAVTGLAVAGGMAMTPSAAHAPKAPAQPKPVVQQQQQSPYNSDKMLRTIESVESQHGKFTHHKPVSGAIHGGERAVGKYALMPETIRETIHMNRDLRNKHARAMNLKGDDMRRYMEDNPGLEDVIARKHLNRLEHHFGQNPEKLGYAWLEGIRGTYHAEKEKKDIGNHWHVKKIKDAWAKEK